MFSNKDSEILYCPKLPKDHQCISEIKVLHHQWELDAYAWLVLDEFKFPYIMITDHGTPQIKDFNWISDKIDEYGLVLNKTLDMLDAYKKHLDNYVDSINQSKEDQDTK